MAEKVEVCTADARTLPFPDGTFDAVLTSLVLHHFDAAGRRQARAEIVRLLKPGGYLATLEIKHSVEHESGLGELGMIDVRISPPRPLFFFAARTIVARKSSS